MFTKAIVKTPCKNLINGLTSANLDLPDYEKALDQHNQYINALKQCGLEVIVLAPDEEFPDSTFVEDPALLTPQCAIITNPGAESRRGETESIKIAVSDFYDNIEFVEAPGNVKAGDIMMVGSHYYIGLSERTNKAGASQIIGLLEKYGMTGSTVEMSEMLHLKSGVSYLENNNLVVTGELADKAEFSRFNKIIIPDNESYTANCVWINDKVLIASEFPETKKLIENAGYETIVLDMSEFQKLDGGLSCLSLRL